MPLWIFTEMKKGSVIMARPMETPVVYNYPEFALEIYVESIKCLCLHRQTPNPNHCHLASELLAD